MKNTRLLIAETAERILCEMADRELFPAAYPQD